MVFVEKIQKKIWRFKDSDLQIDECGSILEVLDTIERCGYSRNKVLKFILNIMKSDSGVCFLNDSLLVDNNSHLEGGACV